jgi:uncharacterized protein YyaL (SSP411 family)
MLSAHPREHLVPNHLRNETSLYLKQHANNPVDWFPWSPEALQRAKELDRPIFLSIGYSACHWCHVMEHESFENEATATILNEHFVCIKVDREERPDLDTIYMSALQALTREGGGWPLSVFLSPDLTPFFAGTYFPPDDRYAHHGKPSFPQLLAGIIDAWQNRRDRIRDVGKSVAEFLNESGKLAPGEGDLPPDILGRALAALKQSFDPVNGGFGGAPKFPHALELRLLLRIEKRLGDGVALQMVRHTLDKMARGGIYDQIGGGFHRYSVDAHWLVPHFEKMLYDNALLATTYTEAWQLTKDPFYKKVVAEILDYAWIEMIAPQGSFFSTQDADSEGEEGKFYVWSEKELREVLGAELGEFAGKVWGVTEEGNFEGHNIVCRARSDEADAKRLGLSLDYFQRNLALVRRMLYERRTKRVWPGRDEKVLTAWNGLMITAFATAGVVFDEPKFTNHALLAAESLLENVRDSSGRLLRSSGADQPAKLTGYLEDYAFLAESLVALYEANSVPLYLQAAVELADTILRHFADPNGPGFFFTADDHEKLIARTKDVHDGSTPSGNAVAVMVLLKLAKLCGREDFTKKAEETLRGFKTMMTEHPAASGQMLAALDFYLGPVQEIAVIGPRGDPVTQKVLHAIHSSYRPNTVVSFHDPSNGDPPEFIPLLKDRPMIGGQVTVYLCENNVCQAPLVGANAVAEFEGR